jgi:glycerophosphoryl diester phosphodiesterase
MFSPSQLPLIIAHRGASAHAPENTLAAFQKAIETGADGLEFDVRLTRDNVPVVFHDSNLKRLAGQNLLVSEINSAELADIDVGSWFNRKNPRRRAEAFTRETVPTLERFFDFLGDYSGHLYLELKCDGGAETGLLVETVSEIVNRSKLLSQIIVKSFDLKSLSLAGDKMPSVRRAALFEPKLSTFFAAPRRLVDMARDARADELSLHYSMAKAKLVAEAARFGLTTIIWTSDRPAWVERAARIGVKAIITNDPASLLSRKKEIAAQN